MVNPVLQFGIPQIGVPVVTPDGTMTPSWYRFFSALFQRSGLNTPGISLRGIAPPTVNTAAPAFWVSTLDSPPKLVVLSQVTGARLGGVILPD